MKFRHAAFAAALLAATPSLAAKTDLIVGMAA